MRAPQKPAIADMQKLFDELAKESDRGSALLGASWVEEAIKFRVKFGFKIANDEKRIKEG